MEPIDGICQNSEMKNNDSDSSSDLFCASKPCITWDFNSQPDTTNDLPKPNFTSKIASRNAFYKQLNKFTSPLERKSLKKLIESKETDFFKIKQTGPIKNENKIENIVSLDAVGKQKKMMHILESLNAEFEGKKTIIKSRNNPTSNLYDINNTDLPCLSDSISKKELAQLFQEPNILCDKHQIDSPNKLFEIKTSSPFIINSNQRKNDATEDSKVKFNYMAPPLLNVDYNKSVGYDGVTLCLNQVETLDQKSDYLLDQDLDSLLEKVELPSFTEMKSTTVHKRNYRQIKLNKSLSESVIEKKCSLLDDDLFGTDNIKDLEYKLNEIENIATQKLKALDENLTSNKNTIILCDKTDLSLFSEIEGYKNSCNKDDIEQKRLAALQRLKSRSGPITRKPNFFPKLNSTFRQ